MSVVSGNWERSSLAPRGFHLYMDRGRVTILSNQVDNFFQDDIIFFLILAWVRRFQKAADLRVDVRLGTGTSKFAHDRLNITR